MSRARLAFAGATLGVMASQAGHLMAYQLRFGAAATQVQSTGAHAYFPGLLKTGVGLVATFLLLSLLAIGLARVISGRRLERAPAPDMVRLVAALFCFQLVCFMVQETIEMAAGAPATSAPALLLWGTAGQLPAALLAALALRWLVVRVGPAVASLLGPAPQLLDLVPLPVARVQLPATAAVALFDPRLGHTITRRGPPS